MTNDELVAKLHDIEWEDFEVKAAKYELPKKSHQYVHPDRWRRLTGN